MPHVNFRVPVGKPRVRRYLDNERHHHFPPCSASPERLKRSGGRWPKPAPTDEAAPRWALGSGRGSGLHETPKGALTIPTDARRERVSPLVVRHHTVLVDIPTVQRNPLTGLPPTVRPQRAVAITHPVFLSPADARSHEVVRPLRPNGGWA